jgi:hypothetical protein
MKPVLKRVGGRWWCVENFMGVVYGGVGATPRQAWDDMNRMIVDHLSPKYIIQADGSLKLEWPRTKA